MAKISLHLIEEERVNVARRTCERIALLGIDSEEEPEYSVGKATQTEIPMREVHVEIDNWHTCSNAFCFCLLLLSPPSTNPSFVFLLLSNLCIIIIGC